MNSTYSVPTKRRSSFEQFNPNNNIINSLLCKQKLINQEIKKFDKRVDYNTTIMAKLRFKYESYNIEEEENHKKEKEKLNEQVNIKKKKPKKEKDPRGKNESIARKTFLTNIMDEFYKDKEYKKSDDDDEYTEEKNENNEEIDNIEKFKDKYEQNCQSNKLQKSNKMVYRMDNEFNKLLKSKESSKNNLLKVNDNDYQNYPEKHSDYVNFDPMCYNNISFRDMLKQVESAQLKIKSNKDELDKIKQMVNETKISIEKKVEDLNNVYRRESSYINSMNKADNELNVHKSNQNLKKSKLKPFKLRNTFYYNENLVNAFSKKANSNKIKLPSIENNKKSSLPKKKYLF